jgi:hypothetical protein
MGAIETPRALTIKWSDNWKGGAPAAGEVIGTGPSATYKIVVRGGLYTTYKRAHGAKKWEVLLPSQSSGYRAYRSCVDDNKAGIV